MSARAMLVASMLLASGRLKMTPVDPLAEHEKAQRIRLAEERAARAPDPEPPTMTRAERRRQARRNAP